MKLSEWIVIFAAFVCGQLFGVVLLSFIVKIPAVNAWLETLYL